MKCVVKIVSQNDKLLEEIEANRLPRPTDRALIGQHPELPVHNDAFAYRLEYEVEMTDLADFVSKFSRHKDKLIGFFVESWHPVNSIQDPIANTG